MKVLWEEVSQRDEVKQPHSSCMCPREAGVGRVHSDGRRDGLQFPALTEGQPHLALYLARRSGGVRPAAPGLAIQVAATIYDAAADTAAPAAAEAYVGNPRQCAN